jgi:hypothetical protein
MLPPLPYLAITSSSTITAPVSVAAVAVAMITAASVKTSPVTVPGGCTPPRAKRNPGVTTPPLGLSALTAMPSCFSSYAKPSVISSSATFPMP